MPTYTIEKDWTTEAGYRAVVVIHPMGHRCGYVGVPKDHPYASKGYDELDVTVHGGLTYSGSDGLYPVESDLVFFGFDCAHAWDKPDLELMSPENKAIFSGRMSELYREGSVKSLEYCVSECESLAKQLANA